MDWQSKCAGLLIRNYTTANNGIVFTARRAGHFIAQLIMPSSSRLKQRNTIDKLDMLMIKHADELFEQSRQHDNVRAKESTKITHNPDIKASHISYGHPYDITVQTPKQRHVHQSFPLRNSRSSSRRYHSVHPLYAHKYYPSAPKAK